MQKEFQNNIQLLPEVLELTQFLERDELKITLLVERKVCQGYFVFILRPPSLLCPKVDPQS